MSGVINIFYYPYHFLNILNVHLIVTNSMGTTKFLVAKHRIVKRILKNLGIRRSGDVTGLEHL